MEVKSVPESSISNVESSRSGMKKRKKQRKHQSVANGNAETKEKETSSGTDCKNLESKANVNLDSRLEVGENSMRKDFHLGTEQLSHSRRKRKRKENSLVDEKQSDCFVNSKVNGSLESRLKKEANSLMTESRSERDSNVETPENVRSESGEQSPHSKRKQKRKRKKERKDGPHFVVELMDRKENSLIDEKQSDSHVESKVNDSLELGLKEGANSDLKTPENISSENVRSESGEQPPYSKRKQKRKRKERKDGPDFVVELMDRKENSLIDEKQSDSHVESKVNDSLESGLKETQVNEQMVPSEKKRKRKGKGKNGRLSVLNPKANDISSNRNDRDNNEVENNNMCLEPPINNSTGTEAALEGGKRKKRRKRKKLEEPLCKNPDQQDVEIDAKKDELIPSWSNLAASKDAVAVKATVKENNLSRTLYSSLERICISRPKKKLLVLDLNGILVDVIQKPGEFKPDIQISGKGVFKRPFCDDFLHFCFRAFKVGIWSSRNNKNVNRLVSFLLKKWRRDLAFCWHRKQCTITKFSTIEDKQKPLVLKELRKLWEKHLPNLPWKKGEYDESNTLLLDDSPYKALRNPANTAVFPYPYQYRNAKDCSLGLGGDIRKYLEGLAAAENVQKYVEQNPFGQPAITESNPHWNFYCQVKEDTT